MRLFPSDRYELPLPAGHSFPLAKYRLLRERLEQAAAAGAAFSFHEPQSASLEALGRVHDGAYLARVFEGRLSPAEVRRIGFPWSEALVERSRRSTGAAIDAAEAALAEGVAASLAGGTHHAGIAFGEGYCVFNDTAVAIRELQSRGMIRRAAVIDLDVHQGNGTAEIFAGDPSVFTLSVHGARNFPLRKVAGSLDIPLEDGTADEPYLEAVDRGCREAIQGGRPDLLLYIAGADPYRGDRLGRLKVSAEGLLERDRIVITAARRAGLPVAIVCGGGYCPDPHETAAIHAATMLEARHLHGVTRARERSQEKNLSQVRKERPFKGTSANQDTRSEQPGNAGCEAVKVSQATLQVLADQNVVDMPIHMNQPISKPGHRPQ